MKHLKHLSAPKFTFTLLFFGCGLALFLVLLVKFNWRWYWAYWISLSMITLLAYAFDKWQAQRLNGQRVPEMILHLLAVAGGVPGAWMGRLLMHYKSQQFRFTLVLVAASILHLALLWLILVGWS